MKNILITGENGYVGNQFQYLLEKDGFKVERTSLRNNDWKHQSLRKYDVIIHLAALVHNNNANAKIIDYMNVNFHLTKELAEKAKKDGVNQFIFFSTMSIFGLNGSLLEKCEINQFTPYNPITAYGQSKLLAEKEIRKLENDAFVVNIVRPPMIYGKESPGNFSKLIKIANISRIYPRFKNERSVIHIDNLYKDLLSLVENPMSGTIHPQNPEYMNTNNALSLIRKHQGKRERIIELPVPRIMKSLLGKVGIINKVYGSLTYSKEIDLRKINSKQYDNFEQTIEKTLK
ncbi:NAD-dependent epimerase/dehydratase family protein [Staphylococcus cohnii]|uniref:NAD-dependent epimerase/dehydratase family protein n=1 Tax=Staphylococcus TaxID=1279 RepID=UPI000E69EC50|nr:MULTISPECIES: NAD-dependent epimerase/dehydratase family protein [Staphylococcus]MCE5098540.1 NAD-dependent epimerase/dehydratase family protein [Staphylococcus cohnii]MSU30295.1 NAD-dependent epimerase/dehydratase family protein [Staphylococcus sp. McC-251-APC-3A2]RIL80481.1 NAD-dependent epimerase/dehydratase family protein [Staphylococcus cohnii]RIL89004.1 NAD-dependent epimerase/dehydratase family protein [Staphylococcus cohnii]